MRSAVRRSAAGAALALIVSLSLWSTLSYAATAKNVEASVESWYQASPAEVGSEDPTCALPTGCVPQPSAPVHPYPEDTLHVGIAGGRDTARTFLMLDLADLPTGALVTGGTLTLPVLTDEESGSIRPETAELNACSVLGPVKKARGGPAAEQPEFSCATASKAKFNAGDKASDKPTVTVDLEPLAATLSAGGIAIVPAKAARDAGATWRVVFPAREHDAKEQIHATVQFEEAASLGPIVPPPAPDDPIAPPADGEPVSGGAGGFDAPGATGGSGALGPITDPGPALGGGTAPAPSAAAPPAARQPAVAGQSVPLATTPVALVGGYAYPGVWLAPLVLVGVAGVLARCLAGEIELPSPVTAGDSATTEPNLIERLTEAFWPNRTSGSVKT